MTYENLDTYKGSFVNGERSGAGKLTRAQNKYVVEGQWQSDDLPHGTKTYKNGQKYVGDLVDMQENDFLNLEDSDDSEDGEYCEGWQDSEDGEYREAGEVGDAREGGEGSEDGEYGDGVEVVSGEDVDYCEVGQDG